MTSDPADPQKPRVFLLGEFSAGKSTLANALLGARVSPMRVTATQVPPIWYSAGDAAPIHIASDGTESPLARDALGAVPVTGTRALRLFLHSPLLNEADLIDMPGSSDPNMAPDIWDALLPLADLVLWCTPATQAWRQSEAAIWEDLPESLRSNSLLLLTRIDKVTDADDRERLLSRVRRETQGLFRQVLPVSPFLALDDPADDTSPAGSGLSALRAALRDGIARLGNPDRPDPADLAAGLRHSRSAGPSAAAPPVAPPLPAASPIPGTASVTPRRIARSGAARDRSDGTFI